MRVRIARDELRRLRELTQAINQLEREITELIGRLAPRLLTEPGFGPLIAANLVGEVAGAQRFATSAKLARAAGVAPIPTSSGNTRHQRLDQGGNRQINAALHRVIVTPARCHPPTRDYIARRRSEGTSTRKTIRCLKRYLARHVWRLLQPPHPARRSSPNQLLDIEATGAPIPRKQRRGSTAYRGGACGPSHEHVRAAYRHIAIDAPGQTVLAACCWYGRYGYSLYGYHRNTKDL
jgi:Transposase IS116/IS110/IS902 family